MKIKPSKYSQMKIKKYCPSILFAIMQGFLVSCNTANSKAQSHNIKNYTFWNTADGEPLYSQGGGIFRFTDPKTGLEKYYLYVVQYKETELYLHNPDLIQLKNIFF